MIRTLLLLILASVLATVLASFARWGWLFELTSHFRIQLLVIQMILVILLIVLPVNPGTWRAVSLALLGACLITNALAARGYLVRSSMNDVEPSTVRILSANLLGPNARNASVFAQLTTIDADILVLIEYNRRWRRRLSELSALYPYRIELPSEDNYGIAIFSKLEPARSRRIDLVGTDALLMEVNIDGEPANIIAVHTSSPGSPRTARLRNRQLATVAGEVRRMGGSTILVGDLNTTPFSPVFPELLEASGLQDALQRQGWRATWPSMLGVAGIPIDHCLTTADWQTVHYRPVTISGSDHKAILVGLQRTAHRDPTP